MRFKYDKNFVLLLPTTNNLPRVLSRVCWCLLHKYDISCDDMCMHTRRVLTINNLNTQVMGSWHIEKSRKNRENNHRTSIIFVHNSRLVTCFNRENRENVTIPCWACCVLCEGKKQSSRLCYRKVFHHRQLELNNSMLCCCCSCYTVLIWRKMLWNEWEIFYRLFSSSNIFTINFPFSYIIHLTPPRTLLYCCMKARAQHIRERRRRRGREEWMIVKFKFAPVSARMLTIIIVAVLHTFPQFNAFCNRCFCCSASSFMLHLVSSLMPSIRETAKCRRFEWMQGKAQKQN